MHPVLFQLGSFTLGSYGLLLLAGALLALWWLRRLAKAHGADAEALTDLAFGALIAAIVGAKALLLIVEWRDFLADPGGWLRASLRAFGVFYGGFIAAALYVFYAVRKRKLDFLATADLMAPPLVLAQGIGRLGCFAAGCCHGRPASLGWAVTFRDPESLVDPALLDVPLHPVQLYEFLGNLAIAAVLALGLKRGWARGRVFAGWLMLYGLTRYCWEIFRGDGVRGVWLGGRFSTSQLVAMVMVALGVVIWRFAARRADETPQKS